MSISETIQSYLTGNLFKISTKLKDTDLNNLKIHSLYFYFSTVPDFISSMSFLKRNVIYTVKSRVTKISVTIFIVMRTPPIFNITILWS